MKNYLFILILMTNYNFCEEYILFSPIIPYPEQDVDFYTFSLYKTYGPHLALLYGKKEILTMLPNQNHEFLDGDVPYTLNPGGPNHEELSSLIGIHEYFDNLYKHHFSDDINVDIRKKIVKD